MVKKYEEFKIKDLEGYDCYIDMSVDQAIKLVREFLKENLSGQCPLNSLARRRAVEIVVNELEQMKKEFM